MRLINADEHECWACIHHATGKCDTWCDAGESFELREDVKNAKTVEARPVVYGEWALDKRKDRIYCNHCNNYTPYEWSETAYEVSELISNFCPNCGCDMRKKVQE